MIESGFAAIHDRGSGWGIFFQKLINTTHRHYIKQQLRNKYSFAKLNYLFLEDSLISYRKIHQSLTGRFTNLLPEDSLVTSWNRRTLEPG